MRSIKKITFIVFTLLLLVVGSWFGYQCWSFLTTPLVTKPTNFIFTQGCSVKKAANILKQRKLINHPWLFVLFVRLSGNEYNLKAGEYIIEPGVTPSKLIRKMMAGDVLRHTFTIVEGWNFQQIITAINNNRYIKHTIESLNPDEIMAKIGRPGELSEGRFAPDTYLFSGEITDINILQHAYQLMQKMLQIEWDNRLQDVYYHCPYEALIVASLIEKETAFAKEKPIIAGVILRRLEKEMLLQVDPAVIYGLGERYSGKLKKSDFLIDTPYNTYIHKGLPPTPICMPSKDSIAAALHPITSTFWYYVAKGDGTHKFSDSFAEQNKAIKKYLLKR